MIQHSQIQHSWIKTALQSSQHQKVPSKPRDQRCSRKSSAWSIPLWLLLLWLSAAVNSYTAWRAWGEAGGSCAETSLTNFSFSHLPRLPGMRQIRKQPGKTIHWGCCEQEPLLRSSYFLFGKKGKKEGVFFFQFSSPFLQNYPEFPMRKALQKNSISLPICTVSPSCYGQSSCWKTGFSSCSWTFPSIPHPFDSIPDPVPLGPAHLRGC